MCLFFFFKQKTAYEMRISDWSSDGCSSDLFFLAAPKERTALRQAQGERDFVNAGYSSINAVNKGTTTSGASIIGRCPAPDYLQPRPRNRIPYLVVMCAAGDAILLAPDQQRRHRNLAELRAAVDARHNRALLRKESVGAGIGGHRPRDSKQSGVAALLLGEEDRDTLLHDLTGIAILKSVW